MAAQTFDLVDQAEPFMKRYYDKAVLYHTYKDRPALAWIPKRTGVVGGSPFGNAQGGYQVPLMIDDIAGESADFAAAKDARDGYRGIVWSMNRAKRYATHEIDGETIDAMQGVGAFLEAGKPLMDSAINQISNSLSYHFFNDNTGERGVTDSATTNAGPGTITLTAASSYKARSLSLDRTITASSTRSGGTLDVVSSANAVKITSIVLDNGSGQAEIGVSDDSNFTALGGDYIFLDGDYTAGSANPLGFDGLGDWGPDPTGITGGDDHKGVDRSVWKEKLLMLHYTVPFQALADEGNGAFVRNIRKAGAVLGTNEGSPDVLFVDYLRWTQIESDLAGRARYEMMLKDGPYKGFEGFDSLVINCAGKHVRVVADPWCPPNQGFLLQRNTWEMFSTRTIPGPVSRDGNLYHRLEAKDAVEFRLGGYGNIACKAPGKNMVLNFATS